MTEIAWAAGLFEGEGAVFFRGKRPRLQLKMVEESSVRRFQAAVNSGKVYGPYKNRMEEKDGYPRQDFWMWVAEGGEAAMTAWALEPFLSPWRKSLFERFWDGPQAARAA